MFFIIWRCCAFPRNGCLWRCKVRFSFFYCFIWRFLRFVVLFLLYVRYMVLWKNHIPKKLYVNARRVKWIWSNWPTQYKNRGMGVCLLPSVGGVVAVDHLCRCCHCVCFSAYVISARRRKPPHCKPGAWGLAPTFLFGSFSLPASRACMCVAHYPFGMGSALHTYTFGRVWRWPCSCVGVWG